MFLNIDKFEGNSLAAIDDSGSSITYSELLQFSDVFNRLMEKRSLIFILSENVVGSLIGYIGALNNRIVPLIINANSEKELFNHLFTVYQPEYIWLPESMKNRFNYSVLYNIYEYCLLKTGLPSKTLNEELALLLPTSGSTGSTKLVRHSYKNIQSNARNVAEMFNLTKSERPIVSLPMYYTMGLSVVSSHLYVGATLLLVKNSLLSPVFWIFLKEQRATSFTGVPYSFEVLAKLRFTRMNLPDLKLITQGGGKMSENLFNMYAEYAHNNDKKFIATYGQTECTARMTYLPAELATSKTCSIGIAEPNGELWIVDENGNKVEDLEASGQMVFKGDNVTLGYAYNLDDLAKGDENNGIRFTGDIVRRDKDGCYYVIGRMERFLKLYGFRVGLDECESMIKEAFHIESACIGDDENMLIYLTNKDCYEKVISLLSKKTGIIASAFQVRIIDEIPKNEAGKTMYNKLKK